MSPKRTQRLPQAFEDRTPAEKRKKRGKLNRRQLEYIRDEILSGRDKTLAHNIRFKFPELNLGPREAYMMVKQIIDRKSYTYIWDEQAFASIPDIRRPGQKKIYDPEKKKFKRVEINAYNAVVNFLSRLEKGEVKVNECMEVAMSAKALLTK